MESFTSEAAARDAVSRKNAAIPPGCAIRRLNYCARAVLDFSAERALAFGRLGSAEDVGGGRVFCDEGDAAVVSVGVY